MKYPNDLKRPKNSQRVWMACGALAFSILITIGCGGDSSPEDPGSQPPTAATASSPAASAILDEFTAIADLIEGGTNDMLGTAQVEILRGYLADDKVPQRERGNMHLDLSMNLLRLGDTRGAIDEMAKTFALADSLGGIQPAQWIHLHKVRSLVYLRQAEVSNCIMRHNRDCCLLPLRDGGVHVDKGPALEARRSLLEVTKLEPDSLTATWLLNVLGMAIGDYPGGVPARYRIPESAFRSDYDIKRFDDVAPELGVDTFNQCGGVIEDDFDGDGLLDIVISTFDLRGPLTLFHGLEGGKFEQASTVPGLSDQLGGLNLIANDYDNDGDLDILVLRGAWLYDDGQIRNSLIRNNGDGSFTDVTHSAGLADPPRPTQAAVWADFDNDGDLDLFVGNESRRQMEKDGSGDYPSQYFRNQGNGKFVEMAAELGLTNDRYAKGVSAGDYDNDGDMDLYLSNIGRNRLYRNDGTGRFTDVAVELGVAEPSGRSFATWFWDFDNDGWLDIFVTSYECSIDDIAADYLGREHPGKMPRLYRNNRKGGFDDISKEVGLNHPNLPMGANFGDLDNDGWLDAYLTTGDPGFQSLMPNVMLRNDRGRRFQNVTTSGGFGHLQKGHGVAFADFDHDGDQDIYHQLGGFYAGDRFHNVLFRNPGHGNHFLVVKLEGTKTNRQAIGARLRVVVETPSGERTLHRAVGSVSSFGGSPRRQEVGLGQASRILKVEIDWPRSGTTQTVTEVPMDSMIRVTEGQDGFERVEY